METEQQEPKALLHNQLQLTIPSSSSSFSSSGITKAIDVHDEEEHIHGGWEAPSVQRRTYALIGGMGFRNQRTPKEIQNMAWRFSHRGKGRSSSRRHLSHHYRRLCFPQLPGTSRCASRRTTHRLATIKPITFPPDSITLIGLVQQEKQLQEGL